MSDVKAGRVILAPVDVVRSARSRILPQTEAERAAQVDSLLARWVGRWRFGTVAGQGLREAAGHWERCRGRELGRGHCGGYWGIDRRLLRNLDLGRLAPCGTSERNSCEALARLLLTRRDIEQLFGLGEVRAAAIMQTLGADLVDNQRTLPRRRPAAADLKALRTGGGPR